MIEPAVQGALIGVGSSWAIIFCKIGFDYLKLKIGKNGGNGNSNHKCQDHECIVATLNKIEEHYEDKRQIELYMEAIRRVNESNN